MDHRHQNKMLIDATHPEETRVVVIRNGRVEEFDFESASKKPLRGNIYLAKVTRVEPSLQAAFVEYGGNRHGFLPFNEIHPDYYQIPLADRQALLDEEMAEHEAEREADERAERGQRGGRGGRRDRGGDPSTLEAGDVDGGHDDTYEPAHDGPDSPHDNIQAAASHTADGAEPPAGAQAERDAEPDPDTAADGPKRPPHEIAEATGLAPDAVLTEAGTDDSATASAEHASDREQAPDNGSQPGDHIEEIPVTADEPEIITGAGAEADSGDALEEVQERPRRQRRRHYKIQEVIKRRQIMLVQVVKEERGTKGAALTTYLSLAGRYTVLMPNTASGGGISRKITQPQDRKRLKEIARELDVPEGMGLIIRTAGAARSTQEIRRDYEYELRLWESIREVTLASTAPSLVYEEGDLIKRSIRDLYSKDIDEIVVAGEAAHKEAQDFMRMLMPSHVKNVVLHDSPQPLFARYPAVDRQMNAMFSPHVPLKSGGYLVINQTEALVAIDINSGKSTREFSIEDTATNTNLEAADEIARQLRLRDLAGLIVIDFIDMEEKRNIRNVERRMKDALRHDRARIQVGRISHFGLLEMSRQRMRTGVLEGSTSKCPHCEGTGTIRSVESVCLAVLRGLEDHLQRDSRTSVTVQTNAEVAIYILNHKRAYLSDIEQRFGVSVHIAANDKLLGANFQIERSAAPPPPRRQPQRAPVNMNSGFDGNPSDAYEDDSPVEAMDDFDEDAQPIVEREQPAPRHGRREGRHEERRDSRQDARTDGRPEGRPEGRGDDRNGGTEIGPDGRRRRRRRRGRRGREEGDRGSPSTAPVNASMDPSSAFDAVDDTRAFDGPADTFDEGDDDQPIVTAAAFPTSGTHPAQIIPAIDDDQPELINGDGEDQPAVAPTTTAESEDRRRRRRGRRGGRQRRERDDSPLNAAERQDDGEPAGDDVTVGETTAFDSAALAVASPALLATMPVIPPPPPLEPVQVNVPAPPTVVEPVTAVMPEPTPKPEAPQPAAVAPPAPKPAPLLEPLIVSDAPARPAKSGWWRRGSTG